MPTRRLRRATCRSFRTCQASRISAHTHYRKLPLMRIHCWSRLDSAHAYFRRIRQQGRERPQLALFASMACVSHFAFDKLMKKEEGKRASSLSRTCIGRCRTLEPHEEIPRLPRSRPRWPHDTCWPPRPATTPLTDHVVSRLRCRGCDAAWRFSMLDAMRRRCKPPIGLMARAASGSQLHNATIFAARSSCFFLRRAFDCKAPNIDCFNTAASRIAHDEYKIFLMTVQAGHYKQLRGRRRSRRASSRKPAYRVVRLGAPRSSVITIHTPFYS